MQTIHLKASSKKNMIEALRAAGFLFCDETGQLITATHMKDGKGYFIAMRGTLLDETGIMLTDEEGNQYAEKEAIPGYHADLLTLDEELIEGVAHLAIAVNSPLASIAGAD